MGRQHGELERVEDADAEQDRGDDAAGARAGLRVLAAAAELRRRRRRTTKKRAARSDQAEYNVGWSWLERWMATRQASSEASADDCMSKNAADAGSTAAAAGGRRVIVVRRRHDLGAGAGEEKESCGSNDVSVVSFDGSSGSLSCYKPGSKSRLRGGGRSLPRRKVASSDHRLHARSHKVNQSINPCKSLH